MSTDEQPLLHAAPAATPRKSKMLTVCPFILGNEFCERLAFYGLASNLSIYFIEVMKVQDSVASIQVSLFTGTAYLTPLLGAWIADGYWGRFKTILVFSMIYAVGMFWMALTALIPGWNPEASGKQGSTGQFILLYGALYTVALGTGGIKPNVSSFGADQFDDTDREERKQKQSFFNWFYFSINVGSLIACTVIVGIQGWNWGIGFVIPAVAMAMAVVLFVAGYPKYTHQEPKGSPLERLAALCWGAFLELFRKADNFAGRMTEPTSPATDEEDPPTSLFPTALASAQAGRAFVPGPLDRAGARLGYSSSRVDEVRLVLRMTPIFLLSIFYWTIYSQMASMFVIQAQYMDRSLSFGGIEYTIPAATMTMFDTFAIIIMIPIYDGIIVPLLKRFRCELTMLQRIGWGFIAAAAAMAAAAIVERNRMAAVLAGSNVGVMQQIAPYLLVGASEVLASIGQIEFFYDQAPDVMRSCCSALSLLTTALGGYLAAFLQSLVMSHTDWLDNIGRATGHLDRYFLLLTGVMLANAAIFIVCAQRYEYKQIEHRAAPPLVGGQHAPQPVRGARSATGAIAIGVQPGFGYQYAGTPGTDVGAYGRSVTYAPQIPIMPGGFR